jgi:hypothetical protein
MAIFLTAQGLDCGVNVAGVQGAFLVKGVTFDLANLPLTFSGASAGTPAVLPSKIDLDQSAHLKGFLDAAGRGVLIPRVQFQVTSPSGQTVYDFRLQGVLVTQITYANGIADDIKGVHDNGDASFVNLCARAFCPINSHRYESIDASYCGKTRSDRRKCYPHATQREINFVATSLATMIRQKINSSEQPIFESRAMRVLCLNGVNNRRAPDGLRF